MEQGANQTDDGWDWPVMLYFALRYLNVDEEVFWGYTPRKFSALVDAHQFIESQKNGSTKHNGKQESAWTTVDQIPGW